MTRQKDVARLQLKNRLDSFVGLQQFRTETSLTWFYRGKKLAIKNSRQLLHKLSDIFDAVYPSSPTIQNELVNRRGLSSPAAGARARLLERILAHPTKPWLGMDQQKNPPEMSMYLSVLRNTGLHREIDGMWRIGVPEARQDASHIGPSLRRICEIVQAHRDADINVPNSI